MKTEMKEIKKVKLSGESVSGKKFDIELTIKADGNIIHIFDKDEFMISINPFVSSVMLKDMSVIFEGLTGEGDFSKYDVEEYAKLKNLKRSLEDVLK